MKKNSILFICLFFLLACTDSKGDKQPADKEDSATQPYVTKTVRDLDGRLFTADSIQVIFYDNPDGDSVRYTRFFTYTETADTAQINRLLKEMDGVYTQEPAARHCRSEGKLFLLRGDEVLKTIYFSARADSCHYFYFIRDGVFVYFPMTAGAQQFLQQQKQKARKP